MSFGNYLMRTNWTALVRQPQTYLLLCGTVIGYGLLIHLSGSRPLAWLGGTGVATVMVGSWVVGYRSSPSIAHDSSNLLEAAVFRHCIEKLETHLTQDMYVTWQPVKDWALQSQTFATRICEQDSFLQSELLEALHTVIDLAQQVADGLKVKEQIQTPTYQQMVQARLQQSCDRMQQSHAQLQELQDQVALAGLEAKQRSSSLPQRLHMLIAANKQLLETSDDLLSRDRTEIDDA